ncbi:ABC transporter substrate-binding protein [Parachitinimonas caeni]|uniref:ABC transporter substrate-binding protein n=1 Tax=Parachitinimonas caeni TaxID=3031301 RepID=A0ABT7DVB5_9NEIS|nr:ABC transporter substrate-binding protein [Parachitinimonas caeni]MDK2123986.1 ABC transporter substrate-binding protein [Parachitinimonas caeni]
MRSVFHLSALALALATTPVLAKPLIFCSDGEPEGFDSAMFTAATTNDASSEAIYNRLVDFQKGSTKVVPGLAVKWEISDDGLTYIFHLRRGVKFHTTEWFTPSREFNADDVLFSFKRQLDKDHPGHTASKQGWPYANDMSFPDLIKSIEKIDPYKVKFVLSRPDAPFLADLGMGFTSIVSAEYGEKLVKDGKPELINTQPVGTGPFVFKKYQKGEFVRYEANPSYWGGKQPIDKLVFAITADPAVRAQKIKAGECNFMTYPKPADVPGLQADSKLHVQTTEALVTSYLAFNTQKKPLADKRVRQALSMAIDKDAIIKTVYEGRAAKAHLPFPPSMWGYNKSIKPLAHDYAKAKDLLKQAGFPNGFETTIWVRVGGGGSNPNSKLTAELIQADWKKVGVEAKIVVMEWAELLKRSKAGEHEVTINGWAGDNGDPDNFLTPNLSCKAAESGENRARWCNKKFDELLERARLVTKVAERTKMYEEAQKIFAEEAPWSALAHPMMTVVSQKNVTGFVPSPFTNNNFTGVNVK